jgi:hypothetical protein
MKRIFAVALLLLSLAAVAMADGSDPVGPPGHVVVFPASAAS